MLKYIFPLAMTFVVTGCASSQLNYNTLDIASTAGDLQTQQVLYNLSQFKDNPFALPAQIDLSAGSASTNNSITPTIGAPFNAATSLGSTLTNTLSAAPSIAAQTQASSARAASTVSVIASDAWAQNWSYVPITNSDELRRLRSLYAFALGNMSDRQLIKEYPLVKKAQPITYSGVQSGTGGIYCPQLGIAKNPENLRPALDARLTVIKDQAILDSDITKESKALSELNAANANAATAAAAALADPKNKDKSANANKEKKDAVDAQNNYDNVVQSIQSAKDNLRDDRWRNNLAQASTTTSCNAVSVQTQVPDEQFLREPSCVICLPTKYSIFSGDERQLFVNPRLSPLKVQWLLDEEDRPSDSAVRLGHFGRHTLYLRAQSDQRRLSEFTLFALTATEESTASIAAAGGGSGSKPPGQQKLLSQFVSSPVSAISPAVVTPIQ